MSDSIDLIKAELDTLGYKTSLFDSPKGKAVSFPYTVETGFYKDKQVTLAISMQGSEQYPEYPPHWIHVTPPIDDKKGGAFEKYFDANKREWIAMSRPPGEMWDQLATKHMSVYLSEHLRRFWDNI